MAKDVFFDRQLHHLSCLADRAFIDGFRPADFQELRATIAASRYHAKLAIFLACSRLLIVILLRLGAEIFAKEVDHEGVQLTVNSTVVIYIDSCPDFFVLHVDCVDGISVTFTQRLQLLLDDLEPRLFVRHAR